MYNPSAKIIVIFARKVVHFYLIVFLRYVVYGRVFNFFSFLNWQMNPFFAVHFSGNQ